MSLAWHWQQPANGLSITIAVIRLCTPLLFTLTACAGLLIGMGLPAGRVTWTCLELFLVCEGSIMAHELAHWWRIRRAGSTAIVGQRGLRLWLAHPPLARRQERLIAAAGPAAGILLCGLAGIGSSFIASWSWWLFLPLLFMHGCSLLPNQPDGRAFWGRRYA